MLQSSPDARLVDVRTRAEWSFVGLPDLSAVGRQPILAEWQSFPDMNRNPDFIGAVEAELERSGVSRDAPVLFLCRSGARSRAAATALTARGYSKAFNISEGFEGDHDPDGHRGTVSGWKGVKFG